MGIEALLTSQVIGLDAALTGKLNTSGGTVTGQLTNALGTITASTPLTISQTWNNAAVSFNALSIALTDSASDSLSTSINVSVDSQPRLRHTVKNNRNRLSLFSRYAGVDNELWYAEVGSSSGYGGFVACPGGVMESITTGGNSFYYVSTVASSNYRQWFLQAGSKIKVGQSTTFEWYGADYRADTNASDLVLARDAAGTLAQRNSTNAQTFRLYNTYTSATSFENLQLQWSSNEARVGTSVGSAGGTLRSLALGSWNSAGTWRSAITITGSSSTEDTTLPNVGVSKINSISGWVAINAIGGGSFYTGDTNSASPGVFFVGTLINPSDTALTHRFAVDPVNNVVHIGGYRRAAAADGLLSASYAKGTDIAGSSLCIAGGRGTGTGAGGSVRIQTAPAGSTGTSLNALVDRLTIDSTGAATFSGQLTNALGTITASTPLTISQTWNNAAVSFNPLLVSVTDTQSASGSLLMDLQVGGASKFSVGKGGFVSVDPGTGGPIRYSFVGQTTSGLGYFNSGLLAYAANVYYYLSTFGISSPSASYIGWTSSADSTIGHDLKLFRDAARTLALRDGVNANVLNIYNTYTSSTSYERGKIAWESNVLKIGTEKGSAGGSARALELQTDGTGRLLFTSDGQILFPQTTGSDYGIVNITQTRFVIGRSSTSFNGITVGMNSNGSGFTIHRGGYIYWSGSTTSSEAGGSTAGIVSNAAGVIQFNGAANSTFTTLQLGGATSSFPAIKRNSAAINFRLADDSADCDITAKAATFSGNVTVSAVNLVTDTTTGTKIGTATTQKIGFYDKTPVVQPTAVADATDAASVITQLNALLSRMRDLGLIAT